MKILWLCNIMLPAIGEELGMPYSNREGWLSGIYGRICKEGKAAEVAEACKEGEGIAEAFKEDSDVAEAFKEGSGTTEREIELGICFPVEETQMGNDSPLGKEGKIRLKESGVLCYAFVEKLAAPELYDERMEVRFKEIIADFKPDMVHIFGTEFPHTLAMVRAYGCPGRTLIGIQGLCFACAEAYMADLPRKVIDRRTFRDWLKKDGILEQQEKFRIRGEREKEAIKGVLHITGRTDFDREETKKVNGKAKYHFMNETMRTPFYSGGWKRENSSPYRIFLSQGDYPLKGFHYVLEALPKILAQYPEACIYVAGNSVIEDRTIKDKIKISSYGKYLLELIKSLHLEGHVKILGRLTAEEMKEEFLKSSLFICPSSLENSPNSMGEAMLLGVPVAAACTGGIPSMIEDGKEGLLYEAGNVEKLAECVLRAWGEPEETVRRAQAARKRAMDVHNGDKNFKRLLEIYREICQ
ncbi:glycosyltransferase [Lachnospiraceae bacterium]|nr:glycosyltransferase [Lachnospiraceae bacterium]